MTTSQPMGLARSRPRRVRGCRCSHAASRLGAEGRGDGKSRAVLDKWTDPLATWWPRGGDAAGPVSLGLSETLPGADAGPGLHPGREVLAGDIGPAVEALGRGRRPVPDVLPVLGVLGVEDVAVIRV